MVGRSHKEPLVVRVATHHPVKHDHVGRLDTPGIDGDVVQTPFGPHLEPRRLKQPLGLRVV
jgi:hypothetical protein